ncbi:hypothetical protein AXK56_10525 [Tsukamurella pulmonis]|uniref:DNA binding domain-containing protein, excisionase family n=2 Tax=Tsukamurella pulmonis TaxID=47312 RepID=A0A1H1FEQ3_9ACTN|nr:hypothetical protein AXK56_10525 [Tsukamurella pulmonis]SDQ99284.1 DNA binding domain-containing protein, excisionase family [Tsukamurella pulmonis]
MTTTQTNPSTTSDIDELRSRAAISIPRAGEILGISRANAYSLADRGELPSIALGGRRLVPTAALRAMLGVEA